jgi:hypothetical protein
MEQGNAAEEEEEEYNEDDFEPEDVSLPASPSAQNGRNNSPEEEQDEYNEDDFEAEDQESPTSSASKVLNDTFESADSAISPVAEMQTPAVGFDEDSAASFSQSSPNTLGDDSPPPGAKYDTAAERKKLRFEQPNHDEEEPAMKSNRSPVRKPTGFVPSTTRPAEQDDDVDDADLSGSVRFEEPEEATKAERKNKRIPTGFVKTEELPPVENEAEHSVKFAESKEALHDHDEGRRHSLIRKPTGFVKTDEAPTEEGEEEHAVKFAESEDGPHDGSRRSLLRKPTGFAKTDVVPPEEDEHAVKFAETEEQPPSGRRNSFIRKPTGVVKTDTSPSKENDEEHAVKFAEPEEVPPSGRRNSLMRKPTGFVKTDTSPSEENEEEHSIKFSEPEEAPPIGRKHSLIRKPTGFVKTERTPSEEHEEEHSVKFSEFEEVPHEGGRHSLLRKPTGFVRTENAPSDEDEEEASHATRNLNRQTVARPCTPLNEGEEGEDDDPDDDDLLQAGGSWPSMQKSDGGVGRRDELAIRKSASAPSLAGPIAVARRRNANSHLALHKRKDQRKVGPPAYEWDQRHHLAGVENENLPKKLRSYFSRPQSEVELKQDLCSRNNMTSAMRKMEKEEVPPTKPLPISCDGGAPVLPAKHEPGGIMRGRDKQVKPWNNRWSQGIGTLNDGMHPLHREYFCKPSLFAEAPSQRWRRYMDVEVARGVWQPIQDSRPPRFGPVGAV